MKTEISIDEMNLTTWRACRIALVALGTMALGLPGCAGLGAPTPSPFASIEVAAKTTSPELRHATIDGAAMQALSAAWDGTNTQNHERLRVGLVARVDGAYRWTEPRTSEADSHPVIRLRMGSEHVATYIVHPHTHTSRSVEANEQVTEHEKKMVDDVDPLHRPIFVLTPSGRLLRYSHGEEVVELASKRGHRDLTRNEQASVFIER